MKKKGKGIINENWNFSAEIIQNLKKKIIRLNGH